MRTTRVTTAGAAMALLITGAPLAGCSSGSEPATGQEGSGEPAVSATASPATEQSGGAAGGVAAGIPDGTWVREITTAEITRRGLNLAPEEITSNYLDDGSAQLVLKTQGARWSILVQDDAGEFEVGDLGETTYDAQGRWVQSSDSTGSTVLLVWKVNGDALTTSQLTSPEGQPLGEDGAQLFLEGAWQRQS